MDLATISWLGLGFGLGLSHALDADHVMAVSVLAARERSSGSAMGAGLRWAVGHGCVLLAAGSGLLLLGWSLPDAASLWAERGVGIVMIGLGLYVWLDLLRRRPHVHLHFHFHDELPPHAHWHVHEHGTSRSRRADGPSSHGHRHGPVMVGALHGLAGSAPLLAVLPASAHSPILGLGYLALFAVGVAVAMGLVSGLLGRLAENLAEGDRSRGHARGLPVLRALCAAGSIALGGWLVALG